MLLQQRVQQEIEENPVLEEDIIEKQDDDDKKDISVDEYLNDDTPSYKYTANNYSKDDTQRQVTITRGLSLQESLVEQLGFRQLAPLQMQVAEYIVGSIDEDGYLRRDLEAISDDIAFSTGIEIDMDEMECLLDIIHHLDPPGIGARSLQECLVLQMESRYRDTLEKRVAYEILKNHFDEFSKKHYEKLMSRMGIDEEELSDAIEEIVSLSPKPGNMFSDGGSDVVQYITPDFILDYNEGEFDLRLNSYNVPEVRKNKRYLEQIR